jgi:hypothetical protein
MKALIDLCCDEAARCRTFFAAAGMCISSRSSRRSTEQVLFDI